VRGDGVLKHVQDGSTRDGVERTACYVERFRAEVGLDELHIIEAGQPSALTSRLQSLL
jgi:hypothetical protein